MHLILICNSEVISIRLPLQGCQADLQQDHPCLTACRLVRPIRPCWRPIAPKQVRAESPTAQLHAEWHRRFSESDVPRPSGSHRNQPQCSNQGKRRAGGGDEIKPLAKRRQSVRNGGKVLITKSSQPKGRQKQRGRTSQPPSPQAANRSVIVAGFSRELRFVFDKGLVRIFDPRSSPSSRSRRSPTTEFPPLMSRFVTRN